MGEQVDCFFLPPTLTSQVESFNVSELGDLTLRAPAVSTTLLGKVADHITQARDQYLARKPIEEIVNTIDQAITFWLSPAYPYRRLAHGALPIITGYSPEMIRVGLPEILSPFRKEGLVELLNSEIGDPLLLDRFRPRAASKGMSRAYGPQMITHLFAGNIPGLPITSLIYGLLAKAANLGKATLREPLMPSLFARSIQEIDPSMAECIAILPWKGGTIDLEQEAFSRSGAVIAYGSESSIKAVRPNIPTGTRFLDYGNRLSFGMIGKEALSKEKSPGLATRAAHDVAFFDQQGCLSPHLFYVETGGEIPPSSFAQLLAKALENLELNLPRGKVTAEEAVTIQEIRSSYDFQALANKKVELIQSQGNTAWTVIYEETLDFIPSSLNRVVRVKPITDLATVQPSLEVIKPYLQTVGVEAGPDRLLRLAEILGSLGASRICPLGSMQHPRASWHHDGRPNLSDLLRWVDLEENE